MFLKLLPYCPPPPKELGNIQVSWSRLVNLEQSSSYCDNFYTLLYFLLQCRNQCCFLNIYISLIFQFCDQMMYCLLTKDEAFAGYYLPRYYLSSESYGIKFSIWLTLLIFFLEKNLKFWSNIQCRLRRSSFPNKRHKL